MGSDSPDGVISNKSITGYCIMSNDNTETVDLQKLESTIKSIDEKIDKSLNKTEADIKAHADDIAALLAKQNELDNQLKAAERKVLELKQREVEGNNYKGELPSARVAKAMGYAFAAAAGKSWAKDKLAETLDIDAKAMGESSLVAGGQLVPDILANSVLVLQNKYGVARQNATVVPLGTGGETGYPKLTGTLTVYNPAEAGSITASDLSLGNVGLTPKKWATLTAVSSELDEDAVVSIGELLAQQVAYAFAKKEDECAFAGDGSATYFGIDGLGTAKGSAGNVAAATHTLAAAAMPYQNICDVAATLQPYAQDNAKWYLNSTPYYSIFCATMLAQGGSTAEEIRATAFGRNPTILGKPVILTNALHGGHTTATVFGVYGDLKQALYLGQRRGLELARSTDVYFASDSIAIRATQRIAMAVADPGDATYAGSYVTMTYA